MKPESTPASHAPLPWAADDEPCIRSSDGKIIADCRYRFAECVPNAAYIVRAVNSHGALVAALRIITGSGPLNNGMRDDNALAIAREALAKAAE